MKSDVSFYNMLANVRNANQVSIPGLEIQIGIKFSGGKELPGVQFAVTPLAFQISASVNVYYCVVTIV